MVPFRRASQRRSRQPSDADDDHDANPSEWHKQPDRFIMTFPIHPLPSMQGPFEESMLDATGETGAVAFPTPNKSVEARQQQLCREPNATELAWNFTYNCHWRHHPKGKFHPLLKTVTQIVFGVHLLHQHLEKSVADVADILLKHVNELDSFLQRANEDLEGSLKDMLFRRKCLRVPMEHVNEFDRLLEDRTYRSQLLEGNVTIERTINRMSLMLNDYLVDMNTFRNANHELDVYLLELGDEWTAMNEDVGRIYSAMCGNTGGWAQFLLSLVAKAEKLGVVLVQVSSYCNEIEKRCGAASRRSLIASRSSSRNSSNSRDAARSFRNFANNKPLPTVPNERPPFMTPPLSNTEIILDAHAQQRQPANSPAPRAINQTGTAPDREPGEHAQQRGQVVQSGYDEDARVDVAVPRENIDRASEYDQDSSNSYDRHPGVTRDDSDTTLRQDVYRPEQSVQFSDEKEVVVPKPAESRVKDEHSPPLTGKDSAYSSISGGSFASPTAVHPRSASAQSSYPRAQFGLFPSSTPGTPKHSVSSRYGAASPALSSPMHPEQPAYLPQRAQTSLDNHGPSSYRLRKKPSLSSLKRLFSKKKPASVDAIAE